MKQEDYHIYMTVDATQEEAFKAINSVTEWWTENLEGGFQKLHDEFTVSFDDIHISTQKLVELIPNRKVVWLVTDSKINFVDDKREWTNTTISFELSDRNNKTQIHFTHFGLVPDIECYDACSNAWSQYIRGSLLSLINTGKGKPTKREQ